MESEKSRNRLGITAVDGGSQVFIEGSDTDIMFNLALLTAAVCDELDITVEGWAGILPAAVQMSCGCIRQSIMIQARGKKQNHENGADGKAPAD